MGQQVMRQLSDREHVHQVEEELGVGHASIAAARPQHRDHARCSTRFWSPDWIYEVGQPKPQPTRAGWDTDRVLRTEAVVDLAAISGNVARLDAIAGAA